MVDVPRGTKALFEFGASEWSVIVCRRVDVGFSNTS